LHLPYESIMAMPSSRRYRAIKAHEDYILQAS